MLCGCHGRRKCIPGNVACNLAGGPTLTLHHYGRYSRVFGNKEILKGTCSDCVGPLPGGVLSSALLLEVGVKEVLVSALSGGAELIDSARWYVCVCVCVCVCV